MKMAPSTFDEMDEIKIVEMSILGCMLSSSDACDEVFGQLNVDDLTVKKHRVIYKAISMMTSEGLTVDMITVADYLDAKGRLEEIGGLSYLGDIKRNHYTIENIDAYIKIITDNRILKTIGDTINSLNEIKDGQGSPREKLEQAESIMSSIGDEHNSGPQRADAALVKLVDVLDSRTMHGDKGITGSTTGIDDLDEMSCGLQDSDLIIIAGRPSMGKSTLAENVLTENAYLGKTTLMFTIEMPSEKILERTFCSRKSVPLTITRQADFSELQWTLFTDFVKEITDDDMKMFFDDTPEIGLPEIRARARKIKRTHGLDMIVIDYLQMMKLPKAENRSLAVGEVTRGLKLLAKELNIPIILLSQLNRSLEQRQDKRPIMADLRESGSIEQDADLIIFIYRDEVYYPDTEHKGIAEIIIAKQRMGPKGTVFAKFEGDYCRFKNRSDNYWGDD